MRIDTRISRPKSFYNTNEYPDNQLKLFGETADITNIREKLYLVCNQDTSRKYTDPKFEVNVVNMISKCVNAVETGENVNPRRILEENLEGSDYEVFSPEIVRLRTETLNRLKPDYMKGDGLSDGYGKMIKDRDFISKMEEIKEEWRFASFDD